MPVEIIKATHAIPILWAPLGWPLSTSPDKPRVFPALAVHSAPDKHANPLGQQPPPKLASHKYQPLAQDPVNCTSVTFASAPTPAGTTTVISRVATIVVLDVDGHEEMAQSRPTRQQPP
jgi:hypothetical protein